MLNWALGRTLEKVVLNTARDDVDSLGPKQWCDLSAEVKKDFFEEEQESSYPNHSEMLQI